MMKFASAAILLTLTTTVAGAQQPPPAAPAPPAAQPQAGPAVQVMTSLPANSNSINHWYKQSVYDPNDNKIGEIQDVLVDREGKAVALIIGVGGFLGIGERDVAVPFNAVRATTKDNKHYLVMNTTKDALKDAKGFRYDRSNMAWAPEDAPATTGAPPRTPAAPAPGTAR